MKKDNLMDLIGLLGIPVLTAVVGLVLFLSPDTATVLVTKVIGWILVACGAGKAISMATRRTGAVSGWIWAAAGVVLGVGILSRPLVLAESLGRFIGILLVIRALSDRRNSATKGGKTISMVTLIVGAVLFLMPMTLTRTILRLCGLVIAVIGIANVMEVLRGTRKLESGEKPKIIDADE
ncbi:MAG: DUF308 domain-containing protein [Oscillospiraceae bacterium]|nr:DUF308 domain-containing protein [Oscillospiraceae bacterium]